MKSDISIKATHKPKKASASPTVTVERPVRHITKNLSFYRVRFEDLDGRTCRIDIPRKDFVNPADAVGKLLEAHARIPRDPKESKELVLRALEAMGEKPTLEITDKVGWDTSSKNAPSFVYFGKTFGPKRDDLLFDGDGVCNGALGKRKGTRKDWRSGLEPACTVSDELVVAISIAASGPLYEMIGATEACIYHFEGARKPAGDKRQYKSSSGKTLCARVAQSMFGKCSSSDLFSSNMTPLAVEEICFSCNQLAVIIDEEGAAAGTEGKTVPRVTLPYRIVGGQGKRRSKYYGNGGGASAQSWLVPVITTAEEELDKGVSKRKEGEQVRMVAIPFPPTWKGGTFCAAKSKKRRNKLAQQVEATIAANYGVAMQSTSHIWSRTMTAWPRRRSKRAILSFGRLVPITIAGNAGTPRNLASCWPQLRLWWNAAWRPGPRNVRRSRSRKSIEHREASRCRYQRRPISFLTGFAPKLPLAGIFLASERVDC